MLYFIFYLGAFNNGHRKPGDSPEKKRATSFNWHGGYVPVGSDTLASRRCFPRGGVIVRGTPFRHAFPSQTLLLLPTPPPPSDASSAFQCVFRLQMRLPLCDSSYASRPVSCTRLLRYVSSPAAYLVSRSITCLPRYNLSPARPASGLALYRHPRASHDIMRRHATSCNIP